MSKPASKTLIGAFTAGAIVLAVLAVVIFGSGKFFKKTFVNVMYFHGSVKGLNVGSPVMFRGVRIGSVKNIELRYDARDLSFIICVYAEFDPDRMVYVGHEPGTEHTEELIMKGLRARLEAQSIVTGQLVINLDFFPGKPIKLMGLDKRYPEIPTIPSEIDEFLSLAEQIPIKEFATKAMHALEKLDKLISSPHINSSLESMGEGLKEARAVMAKINAQIEPVIAEVRESTQELRDLLRKGQNVPQRLDSTLAAAESAMKQAEKTLAAAQEVASDDSTLVRELDSTLLEVSATARSFRFLSDYLQRHPEALIQGKKTEKGDRP
jgi:paraquat-inducible protein B